MWMPFLCTLRLQLIAATDALDLLGTLSGVTEIAIIKFSFCSLKEVTSHASQLLPNTKPQKTKIYTKEEDRRKFFNSCMTGH